MALNHDVDRQNNKELSMNKSKKHIHEAIDSTYRESELKDILDKFLEEENK